MKFLEIVLEIPISIYGGVYILILLVCILSALGGVHSSYEQKTFSKKYIIIVILVSFSVMIFLFILMGLVFFMYEYVAEKFGFLVGIISMLSVPILSLALILCIPKAVLKSKAQTWCKEYPEFYTVQLKHISIKSLTLENRGSQPEKREVMWK